MRLSKIRNLESALNALPVDDMDFADERGMLSRRISELRQELTETKPIGARIDSARDALQRAHARKSDAAHALASTMQASQQTRNASAKSLAEIQCQPGTEGI